MARPIGLSSTAVSAVRTVTGAPVAADNASLTDAHFPLAPDDATGGAINGLNVSSLWLGVEFAGGTSPTVTVELLVRDDGAADGARWKRTLDELAAPYTYQLDGSGFVPAQLDGRVVYPRITAVTGGPTTVVLLAYPMMPTPGRVFY